MERFSFALLLIILGACNCISALAEEQVVEPQQQEIAGAPQQASEEAPDATEYHFHLAGTSYADNDLKTSADQIRQAAEIIKKQLDTIDQELRPLFNASIVEMEMVAENVEQGRVSSVKQLHEVFARAEVALAKHHIKQAQEAWEREDAFETAGKLSACATNLENAIVRTSYEDDGTLGKTLRHSRQLSNKLLRQLTVTPAEVGKVIIDMNVAIGKCEILTAPPQNRQ